jgi:hypothetical protein
MEAAGGAAAAAPMSWYGDRQLHGAGFLYTMMPLYEVLQDTQGLPLATGPLDNLNLFLQRVAAAGIPFSSLSEQSLMHFLEGRRFSNQVSLGSLDVMDRLLEVGFRLEAIPEIYHSVVFEANQQAPRPMNHWSKGFEKGVNLKRMLYLMTFPGAPIVHPTRNVSHVIMEELSGQISPRQIRMRLLPMLQDIFQHIGGNIDRIMPVATFLTEAIVGSNDARAILTNGTLKRLFLSAFGPVATAQILERLVGKAAFERRKALLGFRQKLRNAAAVAEPTLVEPEAVEEEMNDIGDVEEINGGRRHTRRHRAKSRRRRAGRSRTVRKGRNSK